MCVCVHLYLRVVDIIKEKKVTYKKHEITVGIVKKTFPCYSGLAKQSPSKHLPH